MSSSEPISERSPSENCARIKKLGYISGKHMDLYGEHIELDSDPFEEGDNVAVRAVSDRKRSFSPSSPEVCVPAVSSRVSAILMSPLTRVPTGERESEANTTGIKAGSAQIFTARLTSKYRALGASAAPEASA
jgi:hypothetical protein